MASTLSENNTDMGSLIFSLGFMITQNWENQNEKKNRNRNYNYKKKTNRNLKILGQNSKDTAIIHRKQENP